MVKPYCDHPITIFANNLLFTNGKHHGNMVCHAFFAIDGNRIASNHLHGLVARQWADGGTRPTNSLMRLSMGTLMDRLFLQVLLEIHAEKNVRYVR